MIQFAYPEDSFRKKKRQAKMKVHYFQRYQAKENVATANTMLLLYRLYRYSPEKFFSFLKSEFFSGSFEPEIAFAMQEKSGSSVPDATIAQESFKIVVETKTFDWFYPEQLKGHLNSFGNENYKVLLTLAPELMAVDKKKDIEKQLREYGEDTGKQVVHVNTTFEGIIKAIQELIDDNRDYEMQDILDDYEDYCSGSKLIPISDSWKIMRLLMVGTTIEFNLSHDVCYRVASESFSPHDYIGLYDKKSIRAIGKVCARIIAVETENGIKYKADYGELTEDREEIIKSAINDSDKYENYTLRKEKYMYFFVEKFYETDFKKITKGAPRRSGKRFDLTEILNTKELPDTQIIAERLKQKTWN